MTLTVGPPATGRAPLKRVGWWNSLEGFENDQKVLVEETKRIESVQCTACSMFYCDDCECSIPPIPGLVEDEVLQLINSLEMEEASLASYRYMREVRERVLQAVFDAFADYSDGQLATATVIKRTWVLTPEQLISQEAAAIKNQFLTDLKRSGITSIPGPLVAFLHGEYEPTAGLFDLHWHVLSTTEKAKALHRLKYDARKRVFRGYVNTHTGAAPVVVKPVRDRVRQVSYLLKSFWQEKPVRDGRRDRDGVRIQEPYHTLYLVWLDRQRLKDITIMNGVWSRRKGGTDVMKQLYFSVFD